MSSTDGNDLEEALREISREISSEFSCAREADAAVSQGPTVINISTNQTNTRHLGQKINFLATVFPQVWSWTGPVMWGGGSRRARTFRSSMCSLAALSAVNEVCRHTRTLKQHPTLILRAVCFCQRPTPLAQCWTRVHYLRALRRCRLQNRGPLSHAGPTRPCSKTSQWRWLITWQKW